MKATALQLPVNRRKQFIPDVIVKLYYTSDELAEILCVGTAEVLKMAKISGLDIKRKRNGGYRFTKQDFRTIEFCFYLKREVGLSYVKVANYLKNTSEKTRSRKSFNEYVKTRNVSTVKLDKNSGVDLSQDNDPVYEF